MPTFFFLPLYRFLPYLVPCETDLRNGINRFPCLLWFAVGVDQQKALAERKVDVFLTQVSSLLGNSLFRLVFLSKEFSLGSSNRFPPLPFQALGW